MGKTLVVFYSAQGHTRRVANIIASELGADLFEIQPANPYADQDFDWTDSNSRASREHADESLRNIELAQVTPDNWGDYDTVFVGYPIWWGIAAWPINRFLLENSFDGKRVFPFCTSHSSPLGESDQAVRAMTNGGDWADGIRFSQDASEAEIKDWLSKARSIK